MISALLRFFLFSVGVVLAIKDNHEENGGPGLRCADTVITYELNKSADPILPCQVEVGYKVTAVEWKFPNGSQIVANNKCTLKNTDSGAVTVQIQNADVGDCGKYKLKVGLVDGNGVHSERRGHVTLQTIPFFEFDLKLSFSVKKGKTSDEIEVTESGSAPATLSWFKNDIPLVPDNNRVILKPNRKNQPNGILVFNEAHYHDRAVYRCVAINAYGSDSTQTILRVQNPLRWVWPLVGSFGALIVVAIIVAGDEFYKYKRPNKLHADNSADSLPSLDALTEDAPMDVPDMLARVTALGYPPSVISAAVKWRAKLEASRKKRLQTGKHK
ncbi:hypothetical protein BV898_06068 [Hypsibius exemplaris]|uniref:Ig-like domain-containing protein n=1 Tax=Hypsibius exemplaris TaxID=2072580 RepID=A0A1W0WXA6_HYPEX|nr:hypothetical protein BV898_06068 [Hypsibius exemplaris]